MTTTKKPLKNFFKRVIAPIVRATIKSVPGGAWAFEIIDQVKHYKNPDKIKNGSAPHSPVSLLFQAVILACILYAFFTKQITVEQVLNWVGPDDFKSFIPAGPVNGLDTIK
jgi:hypothetical protein